MKHQDEKAFTPSFLATCTDMELVALQHDLRQYPEDAPYLMQVLTELGKRSAARARPEGA